MDRFIAVLEKYGIGLLIPDDKNKRQELLKISEKWKGEKKIEALKKYLKTEWMFLLEDREKFHSKLNLSDKYKKIPEICFSDFAFEMHLYKLLYTPKGGQTKEDSVVIRTFQLNEMPVTFRTISNDIRENPEQYGISAKEMKLIEMFGDEKKVDKKAQSVYELYDDFVYDSHLEAGLRNIGEELDQSLCDEVDTNVKIKKLLEKE